LPESRSDGWKLASYEVAGNTPDKFTRPERTTDSAVPPGRNHFVTTNPAQCAGLISGVAARQFPTVAQIIFILKICVYPWLKFISDFSAAFPRFE
jgi:hypothetical protein